MAGKFVPGCISRGRTETSLHQGHIGADLFLSLDCACDARVCLLVDTFPAHCVLLCPLSVFILFWRRDRDGDAMLTKVTSTIASVKEKMASYSAVPVDDLILSDDDPFLQKEQSGHKVACCFICTQYQLSCKLE